MYAFLPLPPIVTELGPQSEKIEPLSFGLPAKCWTIQGGRNVGWFQSVVGQSWRLGTGHLHLRGHVFMNRSCVKEE